MKLLVSILFILSLTTQVNAQDKPKATITLDSPRGKMITQNGETFESERKVSTWWVEQITLRDNPPTVSVIISERIVEPDLLPDGSVNPNAGNAVYTGLRESLVFSNSAAVRTFLSDVNSGAIFIQNPTLNLQQIILNSLQSRGLLPSGLIVVE